MEVTAKGLVKTYDGKARVLDQVNFEVREGEFFILVGPSGCGKSTLLRMIAGLETISGGELYIDGEFANHKLPKERQISMVFQNYALYPHMTVAQNILFGLDIKKVPKDEQQERLIQTSKLVGLENLLERKPGQLSGGQRQRVALARAICSHAPICLMDEPLSNLDAKLRTAMRREIRRIQKITGMTMIYVTHDQVEAMTMGDRIMVLNAGIAQQIGTPMELYNNPVNEFVATFIGSPQMNVVDAAFKDGVLTLNGVLNIRPTAEQIARMPEGSAFRVGIRPEFFSEAKHVEKWFKPVRVRSAERLGNETIIEFQLGDGFCTAQWPGQHEINFGDEIYIDCNVDNFHFFNPDTHELIRAANPGASNDEKQERRAV